MPASVAATRYRFFLVRCCVHAVLVDRNTAAVTAVGCLDSVQVARVTLINTAKRGDLGGGEGRVK